MKRLVLMKRVIEETHSAPLIVSLLVLILVIAFVLTLIEPQVTTYGDALWYCFSLITTIGFGDITAVTLLGRTLSIILGIFGIIGIGIIVGVFVAYYNEGQRVRHNESLMLFADKLERLPELSPEELAEMSAQVKAARKKNGYAAKAEQVNPPDNETMR